MRAILLLYAFVAAELLSTALGQAVVRLEPTEFKNLIEMNVFAAVIDVRTREEFEAGHIENATLVESLNLYQTNREISTPADLAGCEYCDLAFYCTTGGRAQTSIEKILQETGFKGTLYNGLGVAQWTSAGFPLVASNVSKTPPCTEDESVGQQCNASLAAITEEGTIPTSNANQSTAKSWGEILLFLMSLAFS